MIDCRDEASSHNGKRRVEEVLHLIIIYRMTSVGLAAFRKSLASKALDSSKLQIRSGPQIPVALSTQLVNSVFGIEGTNIFPTLFTETGDKLKVSSSVASQIQSTIALTRQGTSLFSFVRDRTSKFDSLCSKS